MSAIDTLTQSYNDVVTAVGAIGTEVSSLVSALQAQPGITASVVDLAAKFEVQAQALQKIASDAATAVNPPAPEPVTPPPVAPTA